MKSLFPVSSLSAVLILSMPAYPQYLSHAQKEESKLIAIVDGKELSLPLLKADYDVDIQGDVANLVLKQTFINPTKNPLDVTYLFPLNQKAAIHKMEMQLGDEIIQAVIKEKQKAKATFEKAKSQGKAASLLVQHRPNMFTQNITNLMPGAKMEISLSYAQTIPKIDNAYELVIPMVVGPRYEGKPKQDYTKTESQTDLDETETLSGWNINKLPEYPKLIGINAPDKIDPKRVGIDIELNAAFPISGFWSDTHTLSIKDGENQKKATFKEGLEIDNRDFVLRYELSNDSEIEAGILSHYDTQKKGFMSLLIEPPKIIAEETVTPRELVFVLDTSGSMGGLPMSASKNFMQSAIKNLRPNDYFRILRFSNNTTQFASSALQATTANKNAAQSFVAGLNAGGGTEMNNAISAAFDTTQPANTMRIVVFLTDGYIGADRDVIQTVSNRIGNARIYAFGVGRSVNRFLLDGIAKEGRGYARYVGLGESANEVASALAADLKSPLLTDISIDWNGLEVQEQSPVKIPDLFSGNSVRIFGRYKEGGNHKIFINGMVNGRKASMPLDLKLPNEASTDNSKTKAIPLIWAREQIFEKNRQYTIDGNRSNNNLKQEITKLGLDYSLQSRFTSFVAVSQKVINETPGQTKTASVPLPKVSGITKKAYPSLNLSGSSTPEPHHIMGIMLMLMMIIARYWRKLKATVSNLIQNKKLFMLKT